MAVPAALGAAALIAALAGCASSGTPAAVPAATSTAPETASAPAEAAAVSKAGAPASAGVLAERWGVEVVAVRLTAADHMLDVRYKVLDPEKAAPLFSRSNKALLLHPASGAEIPVYSPAKIGPMRPTNPPQAGRVYFTFFSNPMGIVKRGDPVTFKIGEFEAVAIVE